jgi:hypothetical protein
VRKRPASQAPAILQVKENQAMITTTEGGVELDAAEAQLTSHNIGRFRLALDETKPLGGRPPNLLIRRLMEKDGVSRATAFRRLRAKRKARLAKAARMGNGQDHINQHPDGYHPTPPRGARALLARESFKGVLWECACGDGAISRILEAAGYEVV